MELIKANFKKGMPKPLPGQVLIMKSVDAAIGWNTIHTVTAGKTFYLMGIAASFTDAEVEAIRLSFDGGSTVHMHLKQNDNFAAGGSTVVITTGWPMAQVSAGSVITASAGSANVNYWTTIWGWEE